MNKIVLLLAIMIGGLQFSASSQICKPFKTIYFNTAKSITDGFQLTELEALVDSLDENSSYIIELYGFTDHEGGDQLNNGLSLRRARYVKAYINKNFKGNIHSIEVVGKGKLDPVNDNSTENKMALNRRVEVMVFPVVNNQIILRGERGVEVELDANFFAPCSVCGSNPKLNEMFSEQEAAESDVSLLTTDGAQLITGGMFEFDFDCPSRSDRPCSPVKVRMPSMNPNPGMTLWQGVDTLGIVTWEETDIPVGTTDGYSAEIDCATFLKNRRWNWDIRDPGELGCILVKSVYPILKSIIVIENDTNYVSGLTFFDIRGDIDSNIVKLPLTDCNDTLVTARHSHLLDGIVYKFEGDLQPYYIENLDFVGFDIPKKAYEPEVQYTDTTVLLVVPRKRISEAKSYVNELSFGLSVDAYKSKKHKFTYQLPVPFSQVLLVTNDNVKIYLDYNDLKVRYKKRRKLLKVKVKKKSLI